MVDLPRLAVGREVVAHWDAATRREWLVTDGTGAYAMGTIGQARTRRYHGHLVTALRPPVGRTLVVGGIAEGASDSGRPTQWLHSQEWAGGSLDPRGHELCEEFALDGTLPVWRFALAGGATVQKRLWMPAGSQSTVVTYTALSVPGGGRVAFDLRPLLAWRDHNGTYTAGAAPALTIGDGDGGVQVRFAPEGELRMRASSGEWSREGDWYRRFLLAQEWERGLDAVEDLVCAAALHVELAAGETVALAVRAGGGEPPDPADWEGLLETERERQGLLLARAGLDGEPGWVRRLVLAADAFVVARDGGHTLIAGYPWFGDWGRDTMIALPGISLATGRPEVAQGLLRTFAGFVDQGMIPNRFPEAGEPPEYNTVDATLWYVEALRAYVDATGDEALVDELWPVLEEILRWHVFGTRYGIGVDPGDGLLRAGEAGVQLTWMDARVGDWVVTPRMGKPVEVNALWYNALRTLEGWGTTRHSRHDAGALAARVEASFERFWDPGTERLIDVLDGPAGDERTMRPNQLMAVSLHHSPLSRVRAAAVVEGCLRDLTTSLGVRTLAPGDPAYRGTHTGAVRERDAAYHQGTAWPWLTGQLVAAHLRVHGDPAAARELLEPLAHHLLDAGLGSVSEVADGDAPHLPRGCPWQCWSVAEALRAWLLTRAPAVSPAPQPALIGG